MPGAGSDFMEHSNGHRWTGHQKQRAKFFCSLHLGISHQGKHSAAWHRAERCFAEKTERETQLQWRASVPKASSVTGPFADLHPHPAVAEGARPTPLGECIQQFPSTMDTSKTQFNGPVLKEFQQCISISKICY